MARRKRRRGYRKSWASSHVSQRNALSSTFGGIDKDVERLFLALDRDDLEDLLEEYAEDYGQVPAQYARDTFPKWKKGTVRMSGKVAERLLKLVPPRLPLTDRFDLVKKLRQANFSKTYKTVYTTPETWRQDLVPAIRELVEHGQSASISEAVKERADWLADGDTAAAERLLDQAMHEEARLRLAYVETEFQRLEQMIAAMDGLEAHVSHTLQLPQGTISVYIQTPRVSMWAKFKKWLG